MEEKKEKLNIYEKLSNIQSELKAPKGQRNNFGNYNYRSCEDILEAVKPICKKYKTVTKLSDELKQIGERYYVEATATLYDLESDGKVEVTASAREEETKKGMDASQITGTASSYARKYALNGLFNIDDTKDADTDEYANQTHKNKSNEPLPSDFEQTNEIEMIQLQGKLKNLISTGKINVDELKTKYKVKSSADMTITQLKEAIASVNSKVDMDKLNKILEDK